MRGVDSSAEQRTWVRDETNMQTLQRDRAGAGSIKNRKPNEGHARKLGTLTSRSRGQAQDFRSLPVRHGAWSKGVVLCPDSPVRGGGEMSHNLIDITGKKFGKLTAIRHLGYTKWEFLCECGRLKSMTGFPVRNGIYKTCGCGVREATIRRNYKHGKSQAPEHRVWRGMKARCYNPKEIGFKNYGGRGIKVCDKWKNNFSAFLADMGPRPSNKHSIEREDNNGPYSPENCKWVIKKIQCRNKRNNHFLEHDGKRLTIQEWSEVTGIHAMTIESRLRRSGWTAHQALTRKPVIGAKYARSGSC